MHSPAEILRPRPRSSVVGRDARWKRGGRARRFGGRARRFGSVLLCVAALFAAGCHNRNNTSGYGVAWVTLTDAPSDFASYIVNVNSIQLTRSDGALVTALSTNPAETVDFTKLSNFSELWGSGTIPIGSYTLATIQLDYTNAVITVLVNGVPVKANVVDSTGAQLKTTKTINVLLDPKNPFVIAPTYATTSASRLAVDFNLAASSSVDLTTSPPTVTVKPYMTVGVAAPDNKPIRVRGPLINSSVNEGTYTVYVRPFYDEVNSLGALSLFVGPTTIYAVNGTISTGTPGITQLSQSSAGATETAAYTTFQPTATPSTTAGRFNAFAVIGGSTLEDVYTSGLDGYVVARSGNILTVRGSRLIVNTQLTTSYNLTDATITVGPSTAVTADNTTLTGLNYNSIAVGQHIVARGIYTLPNNVVTLDATGASSTNTGSVRLIPTTVWGTLVSAAPGSLVLNAQAIDNWPVGAYTFAGNGTSAATDPVATAFTVNTGALSVPAVAAGEPLWVKGIVAPFGTAPPAFDAFSVNSEASVQVVGATAQAPQTCGQGALDCVPASLQVRWNGAGTTAPFAAGSGPSGLTVDLANANLASAVVRIGAESIDLVALAASPLISAQAGFGTAGLPAIFTPLFSYGNPTAATGPNVNVLSDFGSFYSGLTAALPATPALQLEARGLYDRAANKFYAISVAVVL